MCVQEAMFGYMKLTYQEVFAQKCSLMSRYLHLEVWSSCNAGWLLFGNLSKGRESGTKKGLKRERSLPDFTSQIWLPELISVVNVQHPQTLW